MTHKRETLTIMDSATTFGKQTRISISRPLAVFLVFLFIGCLVATGLLVYHLTSCSGDAEHKMFEPVTAVCNQNSTENPYVVVSETEYAPSTEIVDFTTTEQPKTETKISVRLPKSVLPHSYDIQLIPFIREGNFTFQGEVAILVNVTEATNNITLHADELTVDYSSISVLELVRDELNLKYNNVPVSGIRRDKKRQFLIIHLDDQLTAEQYLIKIKFKGVLNDVLQGFYRSSYVINNQTR